MECEYTDKITCPWCAFEQEDMDFDEGENIGLIICPSCEKVFYGYRNIIISYSTIKAEYGNCPICNDSNIVLEDYHGFLGSHDKMCFNCGGKKRRMLHEEYLRNISTSIYKIK